MTRKTLLIVVGLMAVVGLTFGFATTGLAFPGGTYTGACSGCHTGTTTNPVAAVVSNDGSSATYNVTNGGTEWALFNGGTRVTGAVGATGQFTVPVPGTYTLFAVAGTAGGGTAQGLGQTTVVVAAPLSQFIITATAGSNGTIDPSGAYSATQGDDVKFTFTPDSGYHVADVTVDGTSVGGVTSYTFTNVQAIHTIAVTFAPGAGSTYTITATAGDHGSINPIGDRQVSAGGSIIYTMQPAEGYQVATITIDGVPLPATSVAGSPKCTDGWYTFLNVVQTHTIDVTFKLNPPGWFTVTPYAGEHGTIWMAAQTVQGTSTIPGALVACSIMPDAGYHVETLEVDGESVSPATWYIFYNVRSGHTIAATFGPNTYTLHYTAGTGGTISGTANQTVAHGGSGTAVTAVPNTGYHLVAWSDGITTAARTDSNVVSGLSFSATFALNTYSLQYTAGTGGTISGAANQTVAHGGNGTAVTAVPATGYHFVAWSDGITTAARTDSQVVGGVSASATFATNTYSLHYNAGTAGTISGTADQTVAHGGSGTAVTAVANAGYHFVGWNDGKSAATRTDANVKADVLATAIFAPNTYTLHYTAGTGGTISGTADQTVAHGGSGTAVTAVPATGYRFVAWSDGILTAARTDANVTADQTVSAAFAALPPGTFAITPSAGAHGSISPSTPQTVASGADLAFTITPSAGYRVADVLVDGVSVGAVTSYTFNNVTASHTISATFASNVRTTSLSVVANRSSVRRGARVYFHGVITPNMPNGTHIGFYVRKSTSSTWRLVSVRHSFSSRQWNYYYHPGAAHGTYYIRVKYVGSSAFAACTSKTIKVIWR